MFSGIYNQSCLVKYDKHLYKIKLIYKDNLSMNVEARTESSGEIEEVIRAILNLFLTGAQVPSKILTLNYLISISFKFWKITQIINFYSNGKKLKCKLYIKLSIYSNQLMHINYMTVNNIGNCKMKQKFPLPSTSFPSSSNMYFCNKGPLADFRNMNLRKKHHLMTSGIDTAFKEHFLSHSNYLGEHLGHLNTQNNSMALRKTDLFSGSDTENYNTLFLHSHNESNLKLVPKLHLSAHPNSLGVPIFNNNQNYNIGDLIKIQLEQNATKTKESNSLQYFTLLIKCCKLSQYSSQFCKYTEYNFSAFDQAQKIKCCLKIKTVIMKYLTCCSLKYRSRNQITGTYLRKNHSAKKKYIWLKERLKGQSSRETVKKTDFIRKISFKNRIRKWKSRKTDKKNLKTEDPEKVKMENLKFHKEMPEKLRMEDSKKSGKEDLESKECDRDSSKSTTTDVQNEIFFKPNDRYTVQIQELQEDLKLQHLANLTIELN